MNGEVIFCICALYFFIGLIGGVIMASKEYATDKEVISGFIFWPIYLVGFVLKIVIYIFSLLFDTVVKIFKDVFKL